MQAPHVRDLPLLRMIEATVSRFGPGYGQNADGLNREPECP
jgi:hypothetical protein